MKQFSLFFLSKDECDLAANGEPPQRLGLLEGRMGGSDGGCPSCIDAETPSELCILFFLPFFKKILKILFFGSTQIN